MSAIGGTKAEQLKPEKPHTEVPASSAAEVLRTFPILASAKIANLCPDVHSDELWISSKRLAFAWLIEKITEIDARFPDDPRERKERLRALSREHHILYLMDRLRRKELGGKVEQTTATLIRAAQLILDRSLYPVQENKPFASHKLEDRRALVAARVNWHKLMHAAGVKPPGREGGWSQHERVFRGSAKLFRSLDSVGADKERRDELLRAYIEDRLGHLAAVATEVVGIDRRAHSRQMQLLLHELELALKRARKRNLKGSSEGALDQYPVARIRTRTAA